jgi:large conductance mechanosensitive channel
MKPNQKGVTPMWDEFKKFAMKGNVVDLAVAVIIGGAFGRIVSSLVNDMIMPFIGIILGGISFAELQFIYRDAAIAYGMFLQSIADFIIIAFSIFLFVRILSRMKKKEEVAKPTPGPSPEVALLSEIRDLLQKKE